MLTGHCFVGQHTLDKCEIGILSKQHLTTKISRIYKVNKVVLVKGNTLKLRLDFGFITVPKKLEPLSLISRGFSGVKGARNSAIVSSCSKLVYMFHSNCFIDARFLTYSNRTYPISYLTTHSVLIWVEYKLGGQFTKERKINIISLDYQQGGGAALSCEENGCIEYFV